MTFNLMFNLTVFFFLSLVFLIVLETESVIHVWTKMKKYNLDLFMVKTDF